LGTAQQERLHGLGFHAGLLQTFGGPGCGAKPERLVAMLFRNFFHGTQGGCFTGTGAALNAKDMIASKQRFAYQPLLIFIEISEAGSNLGCRQRCHRRCLARAARMRAIASRSVATSSGVV
jgi:hypothetical protein